MSLYRRKYNPVPNTSLVPTATILVWKEAVINEAALPLIGNSLYDARITNDNGHLWLWDGTQWIDQGDIIDLKWAAIEDKPTSSIADIDDAVSKRHSNNLDHTQGTDQGLDTGGANAVTASQVKTAVTNSHAPHSDDQDLSGKVDKVFGSSLVPDTEIAKIHAAHSDDQYIPSALSEFSDDSTHRLTTDTEKNTWNQISDAVLNILLNAYRISKVGLLSFVNMVNGAMDKFNDETGIDLINSVNQVYKSASHYYTPVSNDVPTLLLAHLNSEPFTDDAGHILTPYGNYNLDTTNKKFGAGSVFLSRTNNSRVEVTNADNLQLGSGPFTIELFFNQTGNIGTYTILNKMDTTPVSNGWQIACNPNNSGGRMYFGVLTAGSWTVDTAWLLNPGFDNWGHLAIVRGADNLLRAYWNGNELQHTEGAYDMTGLSIPVTTAPIIIGGDPWASSGFNGNIDEVRISNIARYTQNFTPISQAFIMESSEIDMTLISKAISSSIVPTKIEVVLFLEDINAITLNTDIVCSVSRNNGTTFTPAVLVDKGFYESGKRIVSATVDVSSQSSGTNLKYMIETPTFKKFNLHGVGLSWR